MKKDLTQFVLILDASGSMNSCIEDTLAGLRKFIETQRAAVGECVFSIYSFSNTLSPIHRIQYIDLKMMDVNLTLDKYRKKVESGGGTALYDCVKEAIDNIGLQLKDMPENERPEKVCVLIVTDGEENSSKKVSAKEVKETIKHQQDVYNWDFSFIGADITTAEAVEMNISHDTSVAICKANMMAALDLTGQKFANYRSTSKKGDLSYSNEERSTLS
jgi:uncharacterized protein YegL